MIFIECLRLAKMWRTQHHDKDAVDVSHQVAATETLHLVALRKVQHLAGFNEQES
ncbi:MAG: hypothetical protein IH905_16305 [Proteobacteria bacterium]|nr:hypothetical protein [Pseudomonadota bacterium]